MKISRRRFLEFSAVAGGSLAAGSSSLLAGCTAGDANTPRSDVDAGGALYRPPMIPVDDVTLTARRVVAEVADGVRSPVLSWGDGPLGPTLEARRGDRARIEMRNELGEPTIAHWHGLRPPEEADGHPRFSVPPGARYDYAFDVDEPAGLYWYHSHAHERTAPQVYHGLAGLFVVRDEVEAALDLPTGEREILLALQDKRQGSSGELVYNPMGHQLMEGFLADTPFVNGTVAPTIEVESALYRVRVLGAANARIFRIGLSNGAPLTLIGTDAGLLDRPLELPYLDLSTGERADLLIDFSGVPEGTTVTLKSLPFPDPSAGGMGMMRRGMGMMRRGMGMMRGLGLPQGAELDLARFVVTREVTDDHRIPETLAPRPSLRRSEATRERVFHFDSMMMSHTINGRSFGLERVDERVPFGATEVWRFVNNGPFPHPVHMHAVHFQVLGRSGGRGAVMPWERGWKDTVLALPGETVDVIARFDSHRGLFLMHCHNLEHEDMGMMMNFVIE